MLNYRLIYDFGKCAIVSAITAVVFLSGIPVLAANQPEEIKDIASSSDYAMQSIRNMAEKGIISGDENGDFYPHAGMTRAEAAKILVLSLGLDTQTVPEIPTFQDVSKDNWAYQYIETAYRAGIVSGVASGRFDPDGNCTREQLAKIFVNSMELSQGAFSIEDAANQGLVNIKDYDKISNWAKDAVRVSVYAGIMQGTGDAFLPDENATKEQLAVVVVLLGLSAPLLPPTAPVSTSRVIASFAQASISPASAKSESVLPESPCGSCPMALRAL